MTSTWPRPHAERLEDAQVVDPVPGRHQHRVEHAEPGGDRDHEREQADQAAGDRVELAAAVLRWWPATGCRAQGPVDRLDVRRPAWCRAAAPRRNPAGSAGWPRRAASRCCRTAAGRWTGVEHLTRRSAPSPGPYRCSPWRCRPTARPLAVRNAVFTSTSPGPLYQCPAMIPNPVQDASPPNAWALTPAGDARHLDLVVVIAPRRAACPAGRAARPPPRRPAPRWALAAARRPPPARPPWHAAPGRVGRRWVWLRRGPAQRGVQPEREDHRGGPERDRGQRHQRSGPAGRTARPARGRPGAAAAAGTRAGARRTRGPPAGARPAAIACAADSRPARSAGPNRGQQRSGPASRPARATDAHHGTCWRPTP